MNYDDLSKERDQVRRETRKRLVALGDIKLKELYYRAITLSEHEAARLAVDEILTRSSLSNRAEA